MIRDMIDVISFFVIQWNFSLDSPKKTNHDIMGWIELLLL